PRHAEEYLEASAWKTAPIPCTQDKQMWMFALPMRVDARAGIDVVVGSKGGNATVGWLEAPANPRDLAAWKFHSLYKAGWIMSLQAHDVNRDGDLDILVSDRKGANRGLLWLQNPGPKAAGRRGDWPIHRIGGQNQEVMFLAMGDLDGDKQSDLICPIRGQTLLRFEGDGRTPNPWKSYQIGLPRDCGTGKGAAIGDINLDGKIDIVFSCENAKGEKSGVRWLSYARSADEANWRDHEISGSSGVKFDRLELVDLDADGDLDVLTCEERDNLGVVWYENPTK
ncbi:MAG: VCBS repeat-containing protein, partial [Planctomycetes bacterium]|nr:VCBS repeat-containing protein [Planctomycetota bacterium]